MDEAWMPPLSLREIAGKCELSLAGWARGHGGTLQEAADDLIQNLLALAMTLRDNGPIVSPGVPPLDPRLLAFSHDLLRIAAENGDIRGRVFGIPTDRARES